MCIALFSSFLCQSLSPFTICVSLFLSPALSPLHYAGPSSPICLCPLFTICVPLTLSVFVRFSLYYVCPSSPVSLCPLSLCVSLFPYQSLSPFTMYVPLPYQYMSPPSKYFCPLPISVSTPYPLHV
jgi:hypothetical protein